MSSTTGTVAGAGAPGAVPLAKLPTVTRERPPRDERSAASDETGTSAKSAKSEKPGKPGAPGKRQPAQRGPAADCTADTAGGLTFDVRLPADTGPGQDPALLLRRRPGPSGEIETVRLPLARVEDGAPTVTLRAALPSTMPLSEGRWNAFLALDDQEPRRLVPGVNDLRSLIDRTPREGRTWLGVRIPYATKHGNLSVRAWLRWPHAEAGSLRVRDGGLVLCGRLYGAEIGPAARLEARPRRGGADAVHVEVAGRRAGDAVTEVAAGGADFTAVLPYPPLAGHQLWDLWLRPGEGEEAIRIARILDDVPDKKRIFTYPEQRVEPLPEQSAGASGEGTGTVTTATPYYTLNNDLAVRVDRGREPVEPGGPPRPR